MSMMKTIVFVIVILVFGITATAMASTYMFQPEPSAMYSFAENGNVNWSGLFDSIERYKSGSGSEFYVHSSGTAGGGTAFTAGRSVGGFFAGQGLSLDTGGNLSGIGQHRNEKVSAVVAALAGFLGADRLGFDSNPHLSFDTFGTTYSIRQVPLPASLWFLFSGLGMLGVARRGWWRK